MRKLLILDHRLKDFFVILAFSKINKIFLFLIDLNILGQISDSKKLPHGFPMVQEFLEKKYDQLGKIDE